MIQIQRRLTSPLALLGLAVSLLCSSASASSPSEDPLRIYIRAGVKTHGPGQHDHPRFLAEWSELLRARGATVQGSLEFPAKEELENSDVLVMYAAEAASIEGEARVNFEAFLERGGGLVVIHDAACGSDPEWFKTRSGGAWEHGHSKWLEGEIGLYFTDPHPITRGIPHFDLKDEIYYDMHLDPAAQVLANSFHDVFSITPQVWIKEDGPYRAFTTLQGHEFTSFSHPAFRTLLLRGIAWAGHREVDSLCAPDELSALRYPPGGPLRPQVADEAFTLHEDFELSLVASEPLVVNPISLDWDARGRMWVAQTPGYPYKEEFSGIPAHDQITILEDTDADGVLDQSKVFADGLDLVTSFVFHGNGVIVTQAPDILWLRDTNGDDVADERVVLFTGFGYGDTHAVTSNMRWGLDGWIYGTQGYSGGASRHIRSPHFDDGATDFGHIPNGVFRFLPDGSAIEPYSVYGSNTWGLDFTPDGELFFGMANGSHLRHVVMSEDELGPHRLPATRTWKDIVDHREVHRLSRADRAPYVQIDFVGGFTAASGCTLYTGGAWPAEFAGNHFVCEPTVNLVHRDLISAEGTSFVAKKPRREEFLASTDPWFRPVLTRVGPDGALYVLDFYNQAAVHNDTRGPKHGPTNAAVRPDRDRHHGRVWRVQHKDAPQAPEAGTNFWAAMADLRGSLDGTRTGAVAPKLDSPRPAERVRALWSAFHRGEADHSFLRLGLGDRDAGVRRNAARIAGELYAREKAQGLLFPLSVRVIDRHPRVQLAAISALRHFDLEEADVQTLVPYYSLLENDLARSAFLRMSQENTALFLRVAIELRGMASDPKEVAAYNDLLARLVGIQTRSGDVSGLVDTLEALALAGTSVGGSLPGVLGSIEGERDDAFSFGDSDERAARVIAQLFELHAANARVSAALLPLAARIESSAVLREPIAAMAAGLFVQVADPDAAIERRLESLATLMALPTQRMAAIQASARFLDPYFTPSTLQRVIDDLGNLQEVEAAIVLAEAFPRVTSDFRQAIFQKLIARPSWTAKLLDKIETGDIQVAELGPRRLFQLREHADAATAERSRRVLEGPTSTTAPEIEALIASLLPVIRQPADVANGQELFVQNCAVCHRYEGLPDGVGADVGPSLTGMGAHGAEHLLPFVVDPNRAVEAAYLEYVAETVDGQLIAGVLTYDGPDAITLAHSGGEETIRRDEIDSLRSTGRSPMPTGFEELGAEGLRDILGFLCQGYEDFRVVRLSNHYNASSTLGLYDRRHDAKPMRFREYGVVDVAGTPMEIGDPERAPDGNNAIVLKGGARAEWQSKTDMPRKVEIEIGFALQRMHVLGGISAWGHPFFGEEEPAVRWTFHYADGTDEVIVLHDGHEFADWIGRHDVPGSEYVEGLLADNSWGQVRRFSVDPAKRDVVVERLTLESFDGRTAPTFLALTAQLHGATPKPARTQPELTQPRLLIFGGGSSHDFSRWFDQSLRETFATGEALEESEVEYTERSSELAPRLAGLDALVLSNNRPISDEGLRAGIFEYVAAGGGLLIVHAACWYNWDDWPAYNRDLVGGGSRSHEAYGEFDVRLDVEGDPLLEGLPKNFAITDELYRFVPDPEGTPIEVLATGISRKRGETYPVIWRVETKAGNVIGTTLGHDGAAHEHPAFRRLMQNASRELAGSN